MCVFNIYMFINIWALRSSCKVIHNQKVYTKRFLNFLQGLAGPAGPPGEVVTIISGAKQADITESGPRGDKGYPGDPGLEGLPGLPGRPGNDVSYLIWDKTFFFVQSSFTVQLFIKIQLFTPGTY